MPYAELHCLSNFSFLEGASHPDELVARAAQLGYTAIAITDRNSLAGVVRAHTATKDHPVDLIIGSEITPTDGASVVLWAKDRQGYGNLCRLITRGRRRASKGQCELTVDDIADCCGGLIAGVVPPSRHEKTLGKQSVLVGDGNRYRDIFGDLSYLLAHLHHGPHDQYRSEWLTDLSRQTQLPLVAAGNVLFHDPGRKPLHDVLTAIRHRSSVAEIGEHLLPNAQRHLHTVKEMRSRFTGMEGAFDRTTEIASQCAFNLSELRYEYPEELAPAGMTPIEHLRQQTWAEAEKRYPDGIPEKVHDLLQHELKLISDLRYEAYFLTVWDLVRFARSREILCQGRGSAANSAVCFCLGITAVDPQHSELLFERFISRERDEAPDIDVDFEHERREEVLQYIYSKYGRQRSAMTAVTITYRPRSAIRDLGKAMGFSLSLVDRLAKNANYFDSSDAEQRLQETGLDCGTNGGKQFLYLLRQLVGFPRHLSQHTGGMVITRGPLDELVPIENASMEGRTVVQWNKDDLDDLGILKVDCLALGMLTAIRKCFDLIKSTTGQRHTLASIPEGDPATYDMICKADTVGVFQIESRAQMSMLPRLKPRCYYDLVIEVAIVRPGPIQGDMVHPYLRRREGIEQEVYPNEATRSILCRTLGVPLFQEQCMQLAIAAGGFTPGEADQLRRAMGAWRRPGVIEKFRQKFLAGMKANGLEGEFSERVFSQIQGFGEYGFPESHAASFALLVYVSSWLKCHYPAHFAAAIINSQPMGFYAPAQLIRDARQHDVAVSPIDVVSSDWDCAVQSGTLRLGMRLVRGLKQETATSIVAARAERSFHSMEDFKRRTGLDNGQLQALANADALRGLQPDRRQAIWNTLVPSSKKSTKLAPKPIQQSLFDHLDDDEPQPRLPAMAAEAEVYADYRTTGLSLRSHPMAFQRDRLGEMGVIPTNQLKQTANDSDAKVAGIVLMRQRPSTAKGVTFVTIEDETGVANLILFASIWQRYRQVARQANSWIVHGRVESRQDVIHVIVNHVEALTGTVTSLTNKSRDFR